MSGAPINISTKVRWNEVAKVGRPGPDSRTIPGTEVPRTFLCRGTYSIFTSTLFEDGSGFTEEDLDTVVAWAIIDGF